MHHINIQDDKNFRKKCMRAKKTCEDKKCIKLEKNKYCLQCLLIFEQMETKVLFGKNRILVFAKINKNQISYPEITFTQHIFNSILHEV